MPIYPITSFTELPFDEKKTSEIDSFHVFNKM